MKSFTSVRSAVCLVLVVVIAMTSSNTVVNAAPAPQAAQPPPASSNEITYNTGDGEEGDHIVEEPTLNICHLFEPTGAETVNNDATMNTVKIYQSGDCDEKYVVATLAPGQTWKGDRLYVKSFKAFRP